MQSACIVLYCHLWCVWLYHIFPHYLINGMVFGKTLLNIKCVFWFSLQILSKSFLILRIIQWDVIIHVHRSSCKVPVIRQILMKLEFSRQIFEKYSNNHISWKSIQWEPSCTMRAEGQMGRHNEANCHFSQFCEHPKNEFTILESSYSIMSHLP
jgi:hypothetical protein